MLTEQEAMAFVKGETSISEDGNSQPKTEVNEVTIVENTTSSNDDNASHKTSTEENIVSENIEDKGSEKPKSENRSSKNYSPEEKTKHAFAKEKNKRKEVQNKLADTEKQLAELKKKLEKYQGLTKDDFQGNEDAYTDYKIEQRLGQERVNSLEQQKYQAELEEANEIAAIRLENNFPDENERGHYEQLLVRAETNYASMHPEIGYNKFSDLLMSEEDSTVITYLQDSDISPKLLRHFIMKPESLLKITTMRNSFNKVLELKQLENRLKQFEKMNSIKNKTQVQVQKRELPNTGKIVKNTTLDSKQQNFDKAWSAKDALAYLSKK